MAQSKSTFETLSKINVNDKVEKKNGLSYLSWAWAWQVVKENYPDSTYTIYENADGFNYHHDGLTAWVKTGVTIGGIEHIEYLPVMNFRNKSIPMTELTSFDVNSSIQRSLTKAIARHGLGLYIYAGEDLPETDAAVSSKTPTKKTPAKTPAKNQVTTLDVGDAKWEDVMKWVAANKSKGLTEIVRILETKFKVTANAKTELKKAVK
jgi:hypothetical protein